MDCVGVVGILKFGSEHFKAVLNSEGLYAWELSLVISVIYACTSMKCPYSKISVLFIHAKSYRFVETFLTKMIDL